MGQRIPEKEIANFKLYISSKVAYLNKQGEMIK